MGRWRFELLFMEGVRMEGGTKVRGGGFRGGVGGYGEWGGRGWAVGIRR